MDLDDAADELYGAAQADFVGVRKELVARARAAGDRALATEIGKLRKPTVVGWLVNVLAREQPEQIESVVQLGDALRDAQRHLSAAELKTLDTQRRQLVRALARQAGELGRERGQEVSESMLREVGDTLHAALADPEIGEQVRRGRIVTAASYSGFGPAGLAVVGGRAPERPAPKPEGSALVAAAEAELAEATAAEATARESVATAHTEAEAAEASVTDVEGRITALRAELESAEQERQFARSAHKAATDAAHRADRELERAQQWVAKVRKVLDDLR